MPRFGDKIKSIRSTFAFSNGITNSLSVLKKEKYKQSEEFYCFKRQYN